MAEGSHRSPPVVAGTFQFPIRSAMSWVQLRITMMPLSSTCPTDLVIKNRPSTGEMS